MGLTPYRNPFAYPGGLPGFDSTHPAANGVRLSAVARPDGNMSVLAAPTATAQMSATSTTGKIGLTGPVVVGPTAAQNQYLTLNMASDAGFYSSIAGIAHAAILTPVSSQSVGTVTWSAAGTNGGSSINSGLLIKALVLNFYCNINSVAAYTSSSITLSTGVPYFVALSASTSFGKCNFIVVNLQTGKTQTASVTLGTNFGVPNTTSMNLLNSAGQGFGCACNVSAVYYGINNFLTLPQLEAWGAAPWNFWYPGRLIGIGHVAASTKTAVGNADGTSSVAGVGASLFKGVGNADGTSSVAGVGASLAAGVGNADGVASVSGVSGAVKTAVGNADGVASVSGVGTSLVGAHGNADGSASVNGVSAAISSAVGHADGQANVNGVGVTAALAAGHADGQASVSGVGSTVPPPVPLVPPALRQKSYKHRFLGRSFDPQVVVEKDRPGPLRIIEFSAWMD